MGRKVAKLSLVLALTGALLALGPVPAAMADPGVTVTATDSEGTELPGDTGSYTVVLTELPDDTVKIRVTPNGQVTTDVPIPPGETVPTLLFTTTNWGTAQTVTVTPVNDSLVEATPHDGIVAHSAVGGGYDDVVIADYTIAITDNDANLHFLPLTTPSESEAPEGDTGTSRVDVEVELKTGTGTELPKAITVPVLRTGGTATASGPGADFTFASPTVAFPAGSTDGAKEEVTITINGDVVPEADETIILGFGTPSEGGVVDAPATHTVTILDDETPPGLSVATPKAVQEGAPLTFTVSLAPASEQVVTVKYKTVDGTAKAPGDYTAEPLTTLTFLAGQTTKTVEVDTRADTVDEISETLTLELSDPTNSTIASGKGSAVGTINDDPADNKPPVIDKILITDEAGVPKTTFRRGETVKVNVEFSDPGVADSHQWIVSWQDGTDDDFETIKGSGSVKRSFSVAHQYVNIAPQTVTVIINDGEEGTDREDAITIIITGAGGAALESVGLVDPATGFWSLRNSGGDVTSFFYGNPGDFPVIGDWDCDGDETPGMYRQSDGFVYLRNSNTQGVADIKFFFGDPGDIPIVGDFDGDGCDTVSIYRPSQSKVFVINTLGENNGGLGAAEIDYLFGNPGDKPFVGDFDGDGTETIGLHRESTGLVYFRNSHTQGVADNEFIFGDPDDRLVAGDWIQTGIDSPAVFRPSSTTFFFRHSNTQGVADNQFVFGEPTDLPVAGNFGLG
jgi:hypothetical protein